MDNNQEIPPRGVTPPPLNIEGANEPAALSKRQRKRNKRAKQNSRANKQGGGTSSKAADLAESIADGLAQVAGTADAEREAKEPPTCKTCGLVPHISSPWRLCDVGRAHYGTLADPIRFECFKRPDVAFVCPLLANTNFRLVTNYDGSPAISDAGGDDAPECPCAALVFRFEEECSLQNADIDFNRVLGDGEYAMSIHAQLTKGKPADANADHEDAATIYDHVYVRPVPRSLIYLLFIVVSALLAYYTVVGVYDIDESTRAFITTQFLRGHNIPLGLVSVRVPWILARHFVVCDECGESPGFNPWVGAYIMLFYLWAGFYYTIFNNQYVIAATIVYSLQHEPLTNSDRRKLRAYGQVGVRDYRNVFRNFSPNPVAPTYHRVVQTITIRRGWVMRYGDQDGVTYPKATFKNLIDVGPTEYHASWWSYAALSETISCGLPNMNDPVNVNRYTQPTLMMDSPAIVCDEYIAANADIRQQIGDQVTRDGYDHAVRRAQSMTHVNVPAVVDMRFAVSINSVITAVVCGISRSQRGGIHRRHHVLAEGAHRGAW